MGELNIIEKSLNTLRVSTLSPTNHLNSTTMSKLIVVNGSEDGIQGVFTNKKLAFECAKNYAEAGAENCLKGMTYAKFCKEMTANMWCQVGEGYGVAYCTTFYKNQW